MSLKACRDQVLRLGGGFDSLGEELEKEDY